MKPRQQNVSMRFEIITAVKTSNIRVGVLGLNVIRTGRQIPKFQTILC